MPYYDLDELKALGVPEVGSQVRIDRSCLIFGGENLRIGNHVRIDALCMISAVQGSVTIGNHVHVAVGGRLYGGGGITLDDFSGLSANVCVFSTNDDYSGRSMTNPTIPARFRQVNMAPVLIGRHALVGANSVILPGVTVGEGAAVGALTLARKSVPPFTIISGNPAKHVGKRDNLFLAMERQLLEEETLADSSG
jgi:dTDP-4-amino-4,6-dideoxy-D-glucose acyltransferase